MATADPAVLDDFLNKFRTQVDAGFGLIQGDVSATLASLVVISIVITALMWAIDENQNVLASLVRKILPRQRTRTGPAMVTSCGKVITISTGEPLFTSFGSRK